MTTLSADLSAAHQAYRLEITETLGKIGKCEIKIHAVLVDVPYGSFPLHRSDPIRDAWIRVEAGRALKGRP